MQLAGNQRRYLRAKAHDLKPLVQIGHAGLTDGVAAEIDGALTAHELIKVRLGKECPSPAEEVSAELERRLKCSVAQNIGKVLVVYRPHPKTPKIQLPRARSKAAS